MVFYLWYGGSVLLYHAHNFGTDMRDSCLFGDNLLLGQKSIQWMYLTPHSCFGIQGGEHGVDLFPEAHLLLGHPSTAITLNVFFELPPV